MLEDDGNPALTQLINVIKIFNDYYQYQQSWITSWVLPYMIVTSMSIITFYRVLLHSFFPDNIVS